MTRALLSTLALGLMATPTSTHVNCGNPYVSFLERIAARTEAMSGQQIAVVHRGALRIFDACDSGHLSDVQAKLTELERRTH